MRAAEVRGATHRIVVGPEASYILRGYQERRAIVFVCSAVGTQRQIIRLMAVPKDVLASQGPDAFEKLLTAFAQTIGQKPELSESQSIAEHKFERADSQGDMDIGNGQHRQVFTSSYETEANSFVFLWNLVAFDKNQLNLMAATLNSLKIEQAPPPLPLVGAQPTSTSSIAKPAITPDFQQRLADFMSAWLTERDQEKILSFIASRAYHPEPFIGTYCDGWVKKGMPEGQAKKIIAENVMGVPSEFPKGTPAARMFSALDRLPPSWLDEAANDPSKDGYVVAALNDTTLEYLFSGEFAESDYGKFLRKQVTNGGAAYWVVFPELMPDGDVFVIFTLWEQVNGAWTITHLDCVCQ